MLSLETPTVRSVALKFGWLLVVLLVLFAPLRLCASFGPLSYQAAYNAEGGHNPTLAPYTQSPENLPAWGAQEWTAAGAQTDRYRTNTKEEDPLGWINDGQRIRIPGLGRFLTPDPLGFADGTNPYTYVHQNPWTKFDPEGLLTGSEIDSKIGTQEQAIAGQQSCVDHDQKMFDNDKQVLATADLTEKGREVYEAKVATEGDHLRMEKNALDGMTGFLNQLQERKTSLVEVSAMTGINPQTANDDGRDPQYLLALHKYIQVAKIKGFTNNVAMFALSMMTSEEAAAFEEIGASEPSSMSIDRVKGGGAGNAAGSLPELKGMGAAEREDRALTEAGFQRTKIQVAIVLRKTRPGHMRMDRR